ncbi:MAG: hypothetical protein AB7G75_33455, partial [Candidatus Binatia bacterium]
ACALTPAWAGDLRFGGGHNRGHSSSGFHRSFGGHGPHTNYGSPAFRSPGFSHSHRFRSDRRAFVRPQRRPFARYRDDYARHGTQEHLSERNPSYNYYGVPHSYSGFTRRRFGTSVPFAPVGPPPVGAAGRTPFIPNRSGVVIHYPFFCHLHGFGYTHEQEFYSHLNFAHRVPLDHVASYCHRQGDVVIFFGY